MKEESQSAVEAAVESAVGAGSQDPLIGDLRRGGLLPLLVLHFVADEPSYGNQLIDRISALTAGALAVNPNTMYPLLRNLEGRGLVSGEWEHPERRSRRFYRITDAGRAERDSLRAEVEPRLLRITDSIQSIRAELDGCRVAAAAEVPGPEAEVLALWTDTARWPSFVDGFRRVVRHEGDVLTWESTPHGPGRVREVTIAPGVVEVEQEQLRGKRTARYADGVFEVVLEYELKQGNPLFAFFIKRALRDSLRRTVGRFAVERRADAAL